MEDEKYRKELFEFEEKPKGFFPRISRMLPKADFERNFVLTVTLERAIFLTIAIIMLMVIVYALGVEMGKRARVVVRLPPAKTQAIAANNVAARPAMPTQTQLRTLKPSFTIVAGSFSGRENAAREAARLKKAGLDAVIVPSGKYFKVCVGSYADQFSANVQRDLAKIKALYKDAYVKNSLN